jgi:hypothetical protein
MKTVITLVTIVILASHDAATAALARPVERQYAHVTPLALNTKQITLLESKAKKFNLNSNLLMAVLSVEVTRGHAERLLNSPDTCEWLMEQVARVLRRCIDRTEDAHLAIKYYAAGNFAPLGPVADREAEEFVEETQKALRQIQADQRCKSHSR